MLQCRISYDQRQMPPSHDVRALPQPSQAKAQQEGRNPMSSLRNSRQVSTIHRTNLYLIELTFIYKICHGVARVAINGLPGIRAALPIPTLRIQWLMIKLSQVADRRAAMATTGTSGTTGMVAQIINGTIRQVGTIVPISGLKMELGSSRKPKAKIPIILGTPRAVRLIIFRWMA